MRGAERGFLLLSSQLGDPERRPLTPAQLRTLARRVRTLGCDDPARELAPEDLKAMGYGGEMVKRILSLLEEEALLERYLIRGKRAGCVPVTRVSPGYPRRVLRRLGDESPGCLWARGDTALLEKAAVSLVGSRELESANREFAREVGRQAALQGYVLVSGNARGADRTAQDSCLAHGGSVISVVADRLEDKPAVPGVLYLSEECYDAEFSAQRALSRNRVIHCLGLRTFVAQCSFGTGGTWDGTLRNLRFGWSPVYCFADGTQAFAALEQRGAYPVLGQMLEDMEHLPILENLFDM